MARKSFKKESIETLQQVLGLSYENAEKLQRRLYRQLLYRTKTKRTKTGKIKQQRPYNASRELSYSLINAKSGSVKFTQDYMNVDYVNQDTARDILKKRMKKLIRKTGGMKGEVGTAINDYLSGKITYKDFKAKVGSVKRTARYLAVQEEEIE